MVVGTTVAIERDFFELLEEVERFLEALHADLRLRGQEALEKTQQSFVELRSRIEAFSHAAQSHHRLVKLQQELREGLSELERFYREAARRPSIQKAFEAIARAQLCVTTLLEARVLRPRSLPAGDLPLAVAQDAVPLGSVRELQWVRKFWHMFTAAFVVWVYAGLDIPKLAGLIILGTYVAFVTIGDVWRLRNPKLNERVLREFHQVMRRDEADRLNAQTFYGIAVFFAMLLFSKPIACLAILYLGFGDVAASVVGLKWGKTHLVGKASLEGSAACFVVCYGVTLFLLLGRFPEWSPMPFVVSAVGALAASLFEALSGRLNDNLLIPLGSGVLLSLLAALV